MKDQELNILWRNLLPHSFLRACSAVTKIQCGMKFKWNFYWAGITVDKQDYNSYIRANAELFLCVLLRLCWLLELQYHSLLLPVHQMNVPLLLQPYTRGTRLHVRGQKNAECMSGRSQLSVFCSRGRRGLTAWGFFLFVCVCVAEKHFLFFITALIYSLLRPFPTGCVVFIWVHTISHSVVSVSVTCNQRTDGDTKLRIKENKMLFIKH